MALIRSSFTSALCTSAFGNTRPVQESIFFLPIYCTFGSAWVLGTCVSTLKSQAGATGGFCKEKEKKAASSRGKETQQPCLISRNIPYTFLRCTQLPDCFHQSHVHFLLTRFKSCLTIIGANEDLVRQNLRS